MARRVPAAAKAAYAAGSFGWAMMDRLMVTQLMYFYVSPRGGASLLVAATVFGSLMFMGRVVDTLADPLIGNWSDNCRSRLGRRTPFLLWGGLPYVLVSVLLFYPPARSISLANSVYLGLMLALYFFFFTVYVCPYLALLPELARTRAERVNLATARAVFTLAANAVALVGAGLLMKLFAGVLGPGYGFHGMLWTMGLLALVAMYLPVAAVREREYCEAQPANLRLVQALVETVRNRAFLIYLAGTVAFWFGFNMVTMGVNYFVTVLIGMHESDSFLFTAAAFAVAALFFPVVNMLSRKYGLKRAYLVGMALFAVLLPFMYFLNDPLFGLGRREFGLLVMGLLGIPLAGLFILPDALVGEITDIDETKTGRRREAMYFGTQGLVLKVFLGVSSVILTLLFRMFGFTAGRPLGVQLIGPVAAFFILVGFLAFLRYPEPGTRR